MKVAITGATGFLGFRTAELLMERGYEVVGLGRNADAGMRLGSIGVQFARGDLADEAMMTRAFSGCEFVIHSAALAAPWGKHSDFVRINVDGTANVIRAVRAAGVKRLVHISTPSIYMDGSNREDVTEAGPLSKKFINSYAETKWQAEEKIDAAFRAGLPVITLRPQGIFGPGDPHILPRLVKLAERGRLPVIGDGKTRIDLTYVDNVVDAIEAAMLAPNEHLGKKYNLTNGEPIATYPTFIKILSAVGKQVKPIPIPYAIARAAAHLSELSHRLFPRNSEPTLTVYSATVLGRTRTLSIDAIRKDLGYSPKVSVEEGLRRMIEAWKSTVAA